MLATVTYYMTHILQQDLISTGMVTETRPFHCSNKKMSAALPVHGGIQILVYNNLLLPQYRKSMYLISLNIKECSIIYLPT